MTDIAPPIIASTPGYISDELRRLLPPFYDPKPTMERYERAYPA